MINIIKPVLHDICTGNTYIVQKVVDIWCISVTASAVSWTELLVPRRSRAAAHNQVLPYIHMHLFLGTHYGAGWWRTVFVLITWLQCVHTCVCARTGSIHAVVYISWEAVAPQLWPSEVLEAVFCGHWATGQTDMMGCGAVILTTLLVVFTRTTGKW